MASKAVSDAVEARLTANFSRCPVYGRNEGTDTPLDGSPFVVVQYPIASEDIKGIGDPGARLFREEGAFRLVLHAQRGEGIDQALTWMDELRSLFRAVEFDGVVTLAPSPPVEDERNDDGNYYLISTAVPYQYDLTA